MGTLTSRLARGRTALAAALGDNGDPRELRRRNPDGLRRRRARCGAARRDRRRHRAGSGAGAPRRATSRAARQGGRRVREGAGPARSRTPRSCRARRRRAERRRSRQRAAVSRARRARAAPRPGAPASGWRWRQAWCSACCCPGDCSAPGSALDRSRARMRWWRVASSRRALDTQLASEQRGEERGADRSHLQGARRQLLPQLRAACRAHRRPGLPRRLRLADCRRPIRRQLPAGGMQQASSALPPAILRAIEARIDGAALDAEGEKSARATAGLGRAEQRAARTGRADRCPATSAGRAAS